MISCEFFDGFSIKISQKITQNLPKISALRTPNQRASRSKSEPRPRARKEFRIYPPLDPPWARLWPVLGPNLAPKGRFGSPTWPPRRLLNRFGAQLSPQDDPQARFFPDLGPFWGSTWTPKPSQIQPKSMPRRAPFGTSFSDRFLVDFRSQNRPLGTQKVLIFLRFFNDF